LALLSDALGQDETVNGLLYTDRPPNSFEREQLDARGCTFLSNPVSRINRVRFRARDINLIINLRFVERLDLFER
jgi:hypothetical protein